MHKTEIKSLWLFITYVKKLTDDVDNQTAQMYLVNIFNDGHLNP